MYTGIGRKRNKACVWEGRECIQLYITRGKVTQYSLFAIIKNRVTLKSNFFAEPVSQYGAGGADAARRPRGDNSRHAHRLHHTDKQQAGTSCNIIGLKMKLNNP